MFLLAGDHLITDICRNLGMDNVPNAAAGVVFRLNGTYNGLALPEVWDWLARATVPA